MNDLHGLLAARIPALANCKVCNQPIDLVIKAPDDETSQQILQAGAELITQAQAMGKNLIVKRGEELLCRWPCSLNLGGLPTRPKQSSIPLINEMPDPPRALAIVEMNTNRTLYVTSQMERIGGKASALGEDTSRWHLPEELHKLQLSLEQHGAIEHFEYRAFNIQLQEIRNTINAWYLENWRGSPVRVVELLRHEVL